MNTRIDPSGTAPDPTRTTTTLPLPNTPRRLKGKIPSLTKAQRDIIKRPLYRKGWDDILKA